MIYFETDRLILRNFTMDDVPAVHEYYSSEGALIHQRNRFCPPDRKGFYCLRERNITCNSQ
ncbi:MAG: hypothetical protein IJQ02_17245 [Oscillospiraceae bacterium]|nr:hypothetical protein [Oscillospiraceae bacterium]